MTDTPPEADRAGSAPHPRHTRVLHGHAAAERAVIDAWRDDRFHHAWLITGPPGVGKATLAWRIARALLAQSAPPATLDVPADAPVSRRVDALSEPRLALLRRRWDEKAKRLQAVIAVDGVRELKSLFTLSAADGGHRVAIIDAADDMNTAAANALLKLLEEPPARTTLLLVAHQPARLLPTIRSRCRTLRLAPLGTDDLAAALAAAGVETGADAVALGELSGGSVGAAIRLIEDDGPAIYGRLVDLLSTAPALDRGGAIALADSAAARGAETRRDLTLRLIDLALTRLARAGAGVSLPEAAPGEAGLHARLAPDVAAARLWAATAQRLSARAGHGMAVNLDPSALILDMIHQINRDAGAVAKAQGAA